MHMTSTTPAAFEHMASLSLYTVLCIITTIILHGLAVGHHLLIDWASQGVAIREMK